MWQFLFTKRDELFKPVRMYLSTQLDKSFRALLFAGDILLLAAFVYVQRFPYHQAYDLWLAGLAATLGILFVLSIGSALINGRHLNRDPWMRLATMIMFVLCFVSVIATI